VSGIKQKIGKCIDCPPDAEEKPLTAGRCTALHYWKYRASLKPKKQAKRAIVKKISDKMLSKVSQYSKLRKAFLKQHPVCIARVIDDCTKLATDIHHSAGRNGDLFLDISTWKPVCRNCHTWIELHPDKAKELGLSLSRLAT
jgi:hypothetical protein